MAQSAIGFIGLGVMGEPMCRNLARKIGRPVIAFDVKPEPLQRLRDVGVTTGGTVAEVVGASDIVMMSLPSGKHVLDLCEGKDGLLATMRAGQTLVDLGTSPVRLTKDLAQRFAAKGIDYADAPVARTRKAAEEGTLSITVGASADIFARIEPLLRCFASEVTHCGAIGSGQAVKILNNMVIVCTVVALSEAAAMAKAAGVGTKLLFETLAKGSADSFALRNHGMKSIMVDEFPEQAFPVDYMLKDMDYALEMAADAGFSPPSLALGRRLLARAHDKGFQMQYWPIISKLIGPGADQ
jgi:3-hydroxyisobutyrate dehydrogenase-like beta-hydroxyacid dehydrogenase